MDKQKRGTEKHTDKQKKGAALILRIILILAGGALVTEAVFAAMGRNFNLGILMPFVIGIPLILVGIFYTPLARFCASSTLGKLIKWGFIAAYAAFTVVFATTTFLILKNSELPKDKKADAVIVLGAAVRGNTPSVQLSYRLQEALEYYRENPEIIIVVSGGQGHDEAYTEAEIMHKWLVSHGVPEEKVFMESKATSTEENFTLSKAIIDREFDSASDSDSPVIAFVTNRFHVFRSERIAKKLGIDAFGIPAREYMPFILNDYMRECAAIVQYFLSGRL